VGADGGHAASKAASSAPNPRGVRRCSRISGWGCC
jgi:hypothetical protein